jgi:hypothetical protein
MALEGDRAESKRNDEAVGSRARLQTVRARQEAEGLR